MIGQLRDGVEHDGLVERVDPTRGLVEQSQTRPAQEDAGQTEPLTLTLRKSAAQLAHLGIKPVGQRLDQIERRGMAQRFEQDVIGDRVGGNVGGGTGDRISDCVRTLRTLAADHVALAIDMTVGTGHEEIVADRAIEQVGLLTHERLRVTTVCRVDDGQWSAGKHDLTRLGIPVAHEQMQHGRLAAARPPLDTQDAVCGNA